jgi:hypothetical protein
VNEGLVAVSDSSSSSSSSSGRDSILIFGFTLDCAVKRTGTDLSFVRLEDGEEEEECESKRPEAKHAPSIRL